MKINKMIFIEADELRRVIDNDDIYEEIVYTTDYGTNEILSDNISKLRSNLQDEEIKSEYSFTLEQLNDALENALGKDVLDKLENGELDFVQVVYVFPTY